LTLQEHCCGVAQHFDAKLARRDLEEYREHGPSRSTRVLLASIRESDASVSSLIDVGGGVGAIAHELLETGVSRATVIDASPGYLEAAREESQRRGTSEKLTLLLGDMVEYASALPPADVVTLDKVVCCYPDMGSLLTASAARARFLYGIVYPRDSWWVRVAIAVENRVRRMRGSTFRGFIHSNAEIDSTLRAAGLSLRTHARGAWWVSSLYERRAATRR
jgi:magnesium-protoporphyrin O-methyltransferase